MTLVALGVPTEASSESSGPWYLSTTAQVVYEGYSGSDERDSLTGTGLFLDADYLEKAGFTAGYNYTRVEFKSGTSSIDQNTWFLSGRWNFYPDQVPGKITARLDGYILDNDDEDLTGSTDNVNVIAPMVSFVNHSKTRYLDIGYAYSDYGSSSSVNQFTMTGSFAFGQHDDWLQLRAYYIDLSSDLRARGTNDTTALEVKWTRWLQSQALLGMDTAHVGALLGNRVLAVDPDTAIVYNLSDKQTGSLFGSGEWKLKNQWRVLVATGIEGYENNRINDDYTGYYIYSNLKYDW
ncbi:MAG: hypothetical protein U9P00_13980 [Pseudomonadota bacterium]|nr:hypothetical protein [Pseudomonadota bacterium]